MPEIDLLAVVVAGVTAYLFGWLWYSKVLFGKLWMKLANRKESDAKPTPQTILAGLVVTIVTAFVLAHVLNAFEANSIDAALEGALWVWLGFIATTLFNSYLYGEVKFQLYILDIAHYLGALFIMATVLASF